MIYQMSLDLADALEARLFPVRVEYGPERTERAGYYSSSIVIERDDEQNEPIVEPTGAQRNPRRVRARGVTVRAFVYAQSTVAGARRCEHEHECDKIVDGLIVAIHQWGVAGGAGIIRFTAARYLRADERPDVEAWPGVVYMLRFVVPRSVDVKDYEGAGASTATVHTAVTEVEVNGESIGTITVEEV